LRREEGKRLKGKVVQNYGKMEGMSEYIVKWLIYGLLCSGRGGVVEGRGEGEGGGVMLNCPN